MRASRPDSCDRSATTCVWGRIVAILLTFPIAAQTGCATAGDPTARAELLEVERRLLDAGVLRVDYVIEASGAIDAMLHGDLVAQKPSLAAVAAHGRFAGSDVDLRLISDGERIVGGNGAAAFAQPLPPALHEGMLVGLVRMGVLHNLAMLSSGAPPDRTDGSVRDWVDASRLAWFDTNDTTRGISFRIEVNDEPAGEVRLWLDGASGLPVRREQVVHFDHGDMKVSEIYEIETGGIVGPCRFDAETIALSQD